MRTFLRDEKYVGCSFINKKKLTQIKTNNKNLLLEIFKFPTYH